MIIKHILREMQHYIKILKLTAKENIWMYNRWV